jgi:BlaI family transcriptional regulator, penicillinase repressor
MPGKAELPVLSEAQLEIMNVVWEQQECSVAEVWAVLNARRGVARNTVQTLIVRLEDKGWLTHREVGSAYLYRATVSRSDEQRRSVQRMIDTVFDGAAEGLVLTLLNGETLSTAEANRIRQIIANSKRSKP